MILLQFPFTTVKVPKELRPFVSRYEFPVSVVQVAAAAYKNNPSIPVALVKGMLAPGLVAHDLANYIECQALKRSTSCDAPRAMDSFDNVFDLTEPMMRPDVITRSLRRTFKDYNDLIQAGCSLTLGSSIISLVVPAKMGFFGYGMILFCVIKAGGRLTVPAVVFITVFAIATDVLSIFSAGRRMRAANASRASGAMNQPSAAATPVSQGEVSPAAATNTAGAEGKKKN